MKLISTKSLVVFHFLARLFLIAPFMNEFHTRRYITDRKRASTLHHETLPLVTRVKRIDEVVPQFSTGNRKSSPMLANLREGENLLEMKQGGCLSVRHGAAASGRILLNDVAKDAQE